MEYVTLTVCSEEAQASELKKARVCITACQIHCSHYQWDKSPRFASLRGETGCVSQWASIRIHHLHLTFSRQV